MNWFSKKSKDPVCGMDIGDSRFRSDHNGNTYTFCSEHCKARFDKNPQQFVSKPRQHSGGGCC